MDNNTCHSDSIKTRTCEQCNEEKPETKFRINYYQPKEKNGKKFELKKFRNNICLNCGKKNREKNKVIREQKLLERNLKKQRLFEEIKEQGRQEAREEMKRESIGLWIENSIK